MKNSSMSQRKLTDYFVLILKGMGMGAADVVPGVSGGTIAFITEIYEELINSIKSINLNTISSLIKNGIRTFWKDLNGNFLIAVFGGIFISIFTLANILDNLLQNHPIMVWSFFFGLIIASAVFIAGKIPKWNTGHIISLILGIITAYFITEMTPAQTTEEYWFIFLSGALAICAMILPGISGSFILLLLGKYQFVLQAVNELNFTILGILVAGAAVGLIAFSNVLSWLLNKFHNITIAVLAGFMVGSLNKVWPWKETVSYFTDSHGVKQPLVQNNVTPAVYEQVTGNSSFLFQALIAAAAGIILIVLLERVSSVKKR
jgi:putative membrane protein